MISVLIADDHAILRAGLRMLVDDQEDMRVLGEANTLESTLEQIQALSPDVLLLDLTMPDGNGVSVIEPVLAAKPKTRVLVLTMHDGEAYLRKAIAAGAAGYVVKRAADTELLSAIRTVNEGRSYINVGDLQTLLTSAPPLKPAKESLSVLSPREREVLEFTAHGYTYREIAEKIELSVKSVETYRARVAAKLNLRSRAQLVRFALECGLLRPPP
jgi:two-component system response regulator NreC